MTQYGVIIDHDLIPEKTKIYNMFLAYFGNPILTKIRNTDEGSLYAAKIDVMLRENRYLMIITTPDQQAVGSNFKLNDLKWSTLQTRQFKTELPCTSFSYISTGRAPFDSRLMIVEKNDKMGHYSSKDYKMSMCLLAKKEDKFSFFPEIGTIASALETFRTIFKIEI